MPELAEIRIMSDFINSACAAQDFTSIAVSESASNRKLSIAQPTELQVFEISAQAKGKELILTLSQGEFNIKISFAMGMSGHWVFCDRDCAPKHSHLVFKTVSNKALCLVDARRFARWKPVESWSANRGPCPVEEHQRFISNIKANLTKAAFSKPICEVLLDQRYFNGIGNYLRSEILYRASQDPFETAREALTKNPMLFSLCKRVPLEAYQLGGGQLKDWESPFRIPKLGFENWILCYGKFKKEIDRTGRTIWYHPSQLKPSEIS